MAIPAPVAQLAPDGRVVYSHAEVMEFLAAAEVERERLEAVLIALAGRRRRAEHDAVDATGRGALLALDLQEAAATLRVDRSSAFHAVSTILATAEAEAAAIVAGAEALVRTPS